MSWSTLCQLSTNYRSRFWSNVNRVSTEHWWRCQPGVDEDVDWVGPLRILIDTRPQMPLVRKQTSTSSSLSSFLLHCHSFSLCWEQGGIQLHIGDERWDCDMTWVWCTIKQSLYPKHFWPFSFHDCKGKFSVGHERLHAVFISTIFILRICIYCTKCRWHVWKRNKQKKRRNRAKREKNKIVSLWERF